MLDEVYGSDTAQAFCEYLLLEQGKIMAKYSPEMLVCRQRSFDTLCTWLR